VWELLTGAALSISPRASRCQGREGSGMEAVMAKRVVPGGRLRLVKRWGEKFGSFSYPPH